MTHAAPAASGPGHGYTCTFHGYYRFQGTSMESLLFVLPQSEIPMHWYNVVADRPNPPLPPLGPDEKLATSKQMWAKYAKE